jgi:hypothetical protein
LRNLHKSQAEIEKAVDKVKMGVDPGRKRTKTDKWFRRQWFRSMMRDRKIKARFEKPQISRTEQSQGLSTRY